MKNSAIAKWFGFSFYWVIRCRKRCKAVIENQVTQGSVNEFKKNLWLTKFKHYPSHWAYRDFKKMCYKRIYLIEEANKDL